MTAPFCPDCDYFVPEWLSAGRCRRRILYSQFPRVTFERDLIDRHNTRCGPTGRYFIPKLDAEKGAA